MVLISKYDLILRGKDNRTGMIKSHEAHLCPVCGGGLRSRDSRERGVLGGDGSIFRLHVRRLRCSRCYRIHSELPDMVYPYKRYAFYVIQNVLDGNIEMCPAEGSTIQRWRKEFHMETAAE